MRALVTASIAAAAAFLAAGSAGAAAGGDARMPTATPLLRYAGNYYYGDQVLSPYPPACPYRFHYSCWHDPYGAPVCGCRRDPGIFEFYQN